ncbi:DMT family transporter [Neobacillus pocheonensis]|uniref:DMT family transporter n=1 Tax=Neobacillus pocheonensis TaxID=363869 RepID=A0ABT0WG55_9BACI|nr:DMT family transporter [Neobacillus pocheonensis]
MAKSYLILLSCVFIWAGNYLARQFLLKEFSPFFLSAFSLTVISIFFCLMGLITKSFVRPRRKEFMLLCCAGLIGLVANQIFLFTGLKYSTATNASLIFSMSPLITAALSGVILKEKITRQMIIGSFIAIIGLYFVLSVKGQFVFGMGDLLLLGATTTFSCNLIFVRLLSKRLSPFIITSYSFFIGAIIYDPFILIGTNINWNHSISIWVFAVMSVLIGQGITTMMWNSAMNNLGASRSAIVLNLQPIMTMLLDFLIYQNPLTVKKIFGAVLVFTGILLSTVQIGFIFKKRMGTREKQITEAQIVKKL